MTSLVIGHPSRVVCEALSDSLTRGGRQVVGMALDRAELVERARRSNPDLVFADQCLGDRTSAACWDSVRTGATRVLVLGRLDQRSLLDALEGGVDGYLSIESGLDELGRAVDRVLEGELYIPSGMLGGLLRELILRRRDEDVVVRKFNRLSRREREVLRLMAQGVDPQKMAAALYLSPHTIRTHVQNVIDKLEVHSRAEAAALAVDFDLLSRFPPEES
jgi:DNA-binding NarL/FixJ family response regulator